MSIAIIAERRMANEPPRMWLRVLIGALMAAAVSGLVFLGWGLKERYRSPTQTEPYATQPQPEPTQQTPND